MGTFLLVAPGDWTKIDRDIVFGAGVTTSSLADYSGPRKADIYELTDLLSPLGLVPEGAQLEDIMYVETTNEVWAKFIPVVLE